MVSGAGGAQRPVPVSVGAFDLFDQSGVTGSASSAKRQQR
jgi:hypothetical protein